MAREVTDPQEATRLIVAAYFKRLTEGIAKAWATMETHCPCGERIPDEVRAGVCEDWICPGCGRGR